MQRRDCRCTGCYAAVKTQGLCSNHYQEYLKFGAHSAEVREYQLDKSYEPPKKWDINPRIKSFCKSIPVDEKQQKQLELALKRAGRRRGMA